MNADIRIGGSGKRESCLTAAGSPIDVELSKLQAESGLHLLRPEPFPVSSDVADELAKHDVSMHIKVVYPNAGAAIDAFIAGERNLQAAIRKLHDGVGYCSRVFVKFSDRMLEVTVCRDCRRLRPLGTGKRCRHCRRLAWRRRAQ